MDFAWCNVHLSGRICLLVSDNSVVGVNDLSMDLKPAAQERIYTWYCKPSIVLLVGETINLSGELILLFWIWHHPMLAGSRTRLTQRVWVKLSGH